MILDKLKKFDLENINPDKTPVAEKKELTQAQPTTEDTTSFNVPQRSCWCTDLHMSCWELDQTLPLLSVKSPNSSKLQMKNTG
jgi:hypothetical protein